MLSSTNDTTYKLSYSNTDEYCILIHATEITIPLLNTDDNNTANSVLIPILYQAYPAETSFTQHSNQLYNTTCSNNVRTPSSIYKLLTCSEHFVRSFRPGVCNNLSSEEGAME